MRIDAISFGQKRTPVLPFDHNKLEQQALLELNEHYKKTGDRMPVRIDYYPNGTYKINYIKPKRNIIQVVKSLFKK